MAKFTLQEFSLSNRLDTAFNKYIVCKIFVDAALPEALQHNSCLRSLSLSDMFITRNGAVPLTQIINHTTTIGLSTPIPHWRRGYFGNYGHS